MLVIVTVEILLNLSHFERHDRFFSADRVLPYPEDCAMPACLLVESSRAGVEFT